MRHELLALLPGVPNGPPPAGLSFCPAVGFTGVLWSPPRAGLLKQALRRQRLGAAQSRQAGLEALMPFGPVLTCAPGTAVVSGDVVRLVSANAPTLRRMADRLKGKVQFQVAIEWSAQDVLTRFRDAPELRPLFHLESVDATALTGAVSRFAESLKRQIEGHLSRVADEILELPLSEGMLSNHVILLAEGREAVLDRAVRAIDAIWPEGLLIRQIGPGPAMSYGTLRFAQIRPRGIAKAYSLLGLEPDEGLSEARVAARRTELLRLKGADVPAIRAASERAAAHIRSGSPSGPGILYLAEVWSEGSSAPPVLHAVA